MDIDIDTPSTFEPKDVFPNVVHASTLQASKYKRHPAGVYFQRVPTEPTLGVSSVPYNIAPAFGLFKVDFLHLSLLDGFTSKSEIRNLLKQPVPWELLDDPTITAELFQLKNHSDVIQWIKPRDVQSLADCVALIRPGKRHLLDGYHLDVVRTRVELYRTPLPKGCFKKAHAIAYALNIVLQLHQIKRQRQVE